MTNTATVKGIPLSELCYLAMITVLLFAKGIGLYDGQPVFRLVLVAAVVLFAAKMLLTAYSVREFIIVAVLLALGAATYYVAGEKAALVAAMLVVGMKNVPLGRIFGVALVTWTVSFGGMVLLTVTHILDSPFKVHLRFGLGYMIRWGLGHSHPNVLHTSYLALAMLAIYVIGKRLNLKWLALLMLGNLYIFLYSLSTTGFIAVTFLLAFNLYAYLRKKFSVAEKIIIALILPLVLFISFAAPFLLTGRAFDIVNRLVNTRLNLSRYFLSNWPFSLLGTRLAGLTTRWYTIDNSFVSAYVTYGVIIFAIIVAAYFLIIRRFLKADKNTELGLVISSLVVGVTEPLLFNLSMKNVPLWFFGELVYDGNEAGGKIRFLPQKWRGITVPLAIDTDKIKAGWRAWREAWRKNRKRIYLTAAACAVVGGLLCAFLWQWPAGYIAPRYHCDETEGEVVVYLASPEVAESANIVVLEYVDADTPMLEFAGRLIAMEWLRAVVTAMLLAGAVGALLVIAWARGATSPFSSLRA